MKHIIIITAIILSSSFINLLFAQQDCASAIVISSLTHSETGLTTIGAGNNYSSADACTSTAMENEEYVFSYTPIENAQINVTLSNTEIVTGSMLPFANIGLYIIEACPDDITSVCIASSDNLTADPFLEDINLIAGTNYYIIISSENTALGDPTNVNFDIEITENYQNDMAVVSITGVASSCDLSTATIGCYLSNQGLVSETGFTVSYSINGSIPEEEVYTGSIAAGETVLFEFTQLASFPDVGEYEIEIYASMAIDDDAGNNLYSDIYYRYPNYDVFPAIEDFETNNGYWTAGGTDSSWEYGNPDDLLPDLIINSASSGDYCWATNISGLATVNEISYITSPCYDLTSLTIPTLFADIWLDFSILGNTAYLQASVDGGLTWGANLLTWTESTTGWTEVEIAMPSLAIEPNVQFRFYFEGNFINADGMAIDNFIIKEAIMDDIGITEISKPFSGCGLSDTETVTIEITNYGAIAQTDIPVNYSSDGGTTWLASDEIIAITIEPGASAAYTFIATCDLTVDGSYEFHAKTNLFEDEDPSNDEQLHIVMSQATIPAADYLESFELGAVGWYAHGSNSTMELAMPVNTLISAAGEGDYAWVTNADGYNDPAEISYLESPCFDFSSFINPKFKAMIQYETTQILTNFYLEYSIDGTLWDTVQDGGASTNWYGADLMAFGTWGGSSAGWISVATNIPEIAGQSSVKFRFVFNNGTMSMADTEGVAIDQINIYDCTDIPTASFSFDIDGNIVNFQNESTNGTSYEWNFGDNELMPSTSTEENPSFSYLMDGAYTVTLIVTNDCSSVEYSSVIDIATGIKSIGTEEISIYPNPAIDILNISLSNNTSFIYQIINISGEIIEESNINSKHGIIDIKNISAGLYYIKILTAETTQITSFIKE